MIQIKGKTSDNPAQNSTLSIREYLPSSGMTVKIVLFELLEFST
jgi:hypothetical protein